MAQAIPNILVVEDDRETRSLIAKYLRNNACNVATAADGREMVRAMTDHRVDLLILDVMLPGEDGLTLCRKVRAQSQTPIIMLTARGEDSIASSAWRWAPTTIWPSRSTRANCWRGSTRCCAAQAAAYTASAIEGATALSVCRAGGSISGCANCAIPTGAHVAMTSAEFDLLRTFCERPGRVLSRDSLLDLTQGRNAGSFERCIDVLVSRIRRKIEPDPQDATMIKTVRSGGYMFTPRVEAVGIEAATAGRPLIMKLSGLLNLRGISGQIAALVVVSIVSAASDHHRELPAAPARPAGAVVRSRPRPACHGRAVARRSARLGTAAAVRRHRARLSAARYRNPAAGPSACGGRCRRLRTRTACSGASAIDYRIFPACERRRDPQGRHRLAGRHDDFRPTSCRTGRGRRFSAVPG